MDNLSSSLQVLLEVCLTPPTWERGRGACGDTTQAGPRVHEQTSEASRAVCLHARQSIPNSLHGSSRPDLRILLRFRLCQNRPLFHSLQDFNSLLSSCSFTLLLPRVEFPDGVREHERFCWSRFDAHECVECSKFYASHTHSYAYHRLAHWTRGHSGSTNSLST